MSFSGEKEDYPGQLAGDDAPWKVSPRVCPTCGRDLSDILYLRQSFCSTACREIDLMKWLNEEYRFPAEEHFLSGGETDEGE